MKIRYKFQKKDKIEGKGPIGKFFSEDSLRNNENL